MKIKISTSSKASPLSNLQTAACKHVQKELTQFIKLQPKMDVEQTSSVMSLVYDLESALQKANGSV